jgi:uncharacterized metal-binding protein YceD (DUF177 family)
MTFRQDPFKIYVDRLREGTTYSIKEEVPPDFLDIHEKELEFFKPVKISGEAYLADQDLVVSMEAEATAVIPCRICGKPVETVVSLPRFHHSIPVKEVKGAIFLFDEMLREAILLDTPQFAECNDGNCPHRTEVARYLKKNNDNKSDEEGYRPFADIDLK